MEAKSLFITVLYANTMKLSLVLIYNILSRNAYTSLTEEVILCFVHYCGKSLSILLSTGESPERTHVCLRL